MADYFDQQDDKLLHQRLFQLTNASNAYCAEILYGRSDGTWKELRANLIECAVMALAQMGATEADIQDAVDMEFGDPTTVAWIREHLRGTRK